MAVIGRIVASSTANASGRIEAHTSGTPDGHIDGTIDLVKFSAVAPIAGQVQIVGVRISLDGTEIQGQRIAAWSFNRSLDNAIDQGSIAFAQIGGTSPLGNALLSGAPASGLKPWLIELAYVGSDGVEFREPILTDGIADVTTLDRAATVTEAVTVVDKTRLYRDVPVTFSLPSGHNLRRNVVAQKLAVLAGDSTAAFPQMPRMTKPIDISSGDWLSLVQSIFEIDGYRISRDRFGLLGAIQDAIEAPRPAAPAWVFDERHILRTINGQPVPVRIFPAAEAWTKISLKGTKQIVGSGLCGRKTVFLESVGEVESAEPVLEYRQDGGGSVFFDPPGISPRSPLTGSIILQWIVSECGTLVHETSVIKSLLHHTFARYKRSRSTGEVLSWAVCRLEDDSDTARGFRPDFPFPSLHRTSRIHKSRTFKFTQLTGEKTLTKEVETITSIYNPSMYVSGGNPPDTGEYFDRGDGEGVRFQTVGETITQETVVRWKSDRNGYVTSRKETIKRYGKRPGTLYVYADGSTSSQEFETFQEVETSETSWKTVSEDLVSVVTTTWSLGSVPLTSAKTQVGSPPSIEIIDTGIPLRADFDTDEEHTNALQSRKFDQDEIEAECDSAAILAIRPQRELLDAVMEWAENVGELGRMCDRLLLLGLAPGVEFTIAANAWLTEGDFIHIRDRTPGVNLDHDLKVLSVTHEELPAGAVVTRVRGVVWDDQGVVS